MIYEPCLLELRGRSLGRGVAPDLQGVPAEAEAREFQSRRSNAEAMNISGAGHVGKSDLVRFQFMLTAERQQNTVLRTGTKHS